MALSSALALRSVSMLRSLVFTSYLRAHFQSERYRKKLAGVHKNKMKFDGFYTIMFHLAEADAENASVFYDENETLQPLSIADYRVPKYFTEGTLFVEVLLFSFLLSFLFTFCRFVSSVGRGTTAISVVSARTSALWFLLPSRSEFYCCVECFDCRYVLTRCFILFISRV
jgi:hypothetical protein